MTPEFADKLNEPQIDTIERLRPKLRGAKTVDLFVRKDGQDHHFEADWLRHALDIVCGGPLPSLLASLPASTQEEIEAMNAAKGPEQEQRR